MSRQAEAYGTFTEAPTRPALERFFFAGFRGRTRSPCRGRSLSMRPGSLAGGPARACPLSGTRAPSKTTRAAND